MTQYWTAQTASAHDLHTRQARVLPLLADMNSIVEIGSGEGHTLRSLAQPGRHLTGIDISLASLQSDGYGNIRSKIQADARQLPLCTASFDAAVAMEVLEHIPHWSQALAELFRVARRRVIVTVPYKERLKGQRCPHCGAWIPLYGHLHSFAPGDFTPWQTRWQMSIQKMPPHSPGRDTGARGYAGSVAKEKKEHKKKS